MLLLQDFETWALLRKHYLPVEYHNLHRVIDKHCEKFHSLPSFDDLKLSVRDTETLNKLYAVESVEVSSDAYMLLQYLKNEYTQKEILIALESYIEKSIAFEDAEESINHLHQIILDVQDKVELEHPEESMQRIDLFETEENLQRYLALGLNSEFDTTYKFSPIDLVLIGGRRGAGKSIACANVATNVYERGKSAIYFTIEMDSRATLQRCCSIATGVPAYRLATKTLNVMEWEKVAEWWANRFEEGAAQYHKYLEHRNFGQLHQDLSANNQLDSKRQLDMVYEPSLNLAKIRAELDKKIKSDMDVGVIVVDYINQVKRSSLPHRNGQYDWTEQIEVSKALKEMAQEYKTTVISPYQIDNTGEARFSKGILDAADAAFTLDPHKKEESIITFNNVKSRSNEEISFTSQIDWSCLKIGPESGSIPEPENSSESSKEDIYEI